MVALQNPMQYKQMLVLATLCFCFVLFLYFTSFVDQQSLVQLNYQDGRPLQQQLSFPLSPSFPPSCSQNGTMNQLGGYSQMIDSNPMGRPNFISVLRGLNMAHIFE